MNIKINYRPEIDGLRALAVISVILYHAEFFLFKNNLLTGGYIGVDIFFVISGYLISSIIFKEINQKKTFSFSNFYERRARRILPALIFVSLISFVFAWKYLLPSSLIEYSKSILFSIAFTSNFYFYFEGLNYGTDEALLKPFLHTWSLSIEEQFYIFFPLTIFFVIKYFKKLLPFFILIVILVSLVYSNHISNREIDFNFYMIKSRIWELMTGVILSYYETKNLRKNNKFIYNQFFTFLGFILIILSFIYFNEKTRHPSFYTLIPVIGVCFIIWFAKKNEIITKLLSSKILVGTGLISYSLYLWHYPIFAFGRIKGIDPSNFDKIEWLILTFFLSIISYFLVEKNFRNKLLSRKNFLIIIIFSLISLILINLNLLNKINDISKNNFPKIIQDDLKFKPWLNLKDKDGKFCYGWYDKKDFCEFSLPENSKQIILVGDSTMEQLAKSIKNKFLQKGYNLITMNSSACYFLPNYNFVYKLNAKKNFKETPCDNHFQKKRIDKIFENPNSIIITGGMLDTYIDNNDLNFKHIKKDIGIEEGYLKNINNLLNNNFKIIQLTPMPTYKKSISQEIYNMLDNLKKFDNEIIDIRLSIPKEEFLKKSDQSIKTLSKIKHKNYKIVYPHKIFCDLENCYFNDTNNIFFYDKNHLSKKGSEMVSGLIFENIKKLGW